MVFITYGEIGLFESELFLPKPKLSDKDNPTSESQLTNCQQEMSQNIVSTLGQVEGKLLNLSTNKEETPSRTPQRLPTISITPNVIDVAQSHAEKYDATE